MHQEKNVDFWKKGYEICFVIVITAVYWWLQWLIWKGRVSIYDGDGGKYLDIAKGLSVKPPQSFHVLTPKLAAFIDPGSPDKGFLLIAFFSFIGTGLAIDLLLKKPAFKTTFLERMLGVVLFMVTCTGVFMFHYYTLTDSLSYFLLAVACTATVYKKDLLVGFITAIAIFNRETALFILPVWLCFNFDRSHMWPVLRKCLFVFLPAAGCYIVLHYTPLIFGHYPQHLNYLKPEVMLELWNSNLSWLGTDNIPYGLATCVFLAYNIIWIIGFIGWRNGLKTPYSAMLNSLWMLGLPVLATLLIVDWQRGFQPLFIPMIVSGVMGIRYLTKEYSRFTWYFFSFVTIVTAGMMAQVWFLKGRMLKYVIIGMAVWLLAIGVINASRYYRSKSCPSS